MKLGPDCPLDLPSLIDTRLLVQANSGDAYIQRLSTRKLVTVERNGVRASEELFG